MRSFRSRLLLITTMATLLVLPACQGEGGEAEAARGMELALQDDAVFVNPTYFERDRAFKHLRALGITRLRVSLGWLNVMPQTQAKRRKEPKEIGWLFGLYDNLIDAAAANGIRVHLNIIGPAPAWGWWGNHKKGPVRPSVSKFAKFAKIAATHFWAAWTATASGTEPNWKSWLNPPSGHLYRSLYLKAYAQIRKADPDAKILIGETSPYARKGLSVAPIAFLRQMAVRVQKYKRTRKCPKIPADGYAHHPYDFAHAPSYKRPGADNATLGTLSNLTRGLDKLSKSGWLAQARRRQDAALPDRVRILRHGRPRAAGREALEVPRAGLRHRAQEPAREVVPPVPAGGAAQALRLLVLQHGARHDEEQDLSAVPLAQALVLAEPREDQAADQRPDLAARRASRPVAR